MHAVVLVFTSRMTLVVLSKITPTVDSTLMVVLFWRNNRDWQFGKQEAKREARNTKRETRNAERGTRNAKRETRNVERGTRNANPLSVC
jgi:hypothetical protein